MVSNGKVITLGAVLDAYDSALVDWQSAFAFPVFGQSMAGAAFATAIRDGHRQKYWGIHRGSNYLYDDFWNLFLRATAIGGKGPSVEVTFPDSIWRWRGPYQGNLRDMLESALVRFALPQNKARQSGQFKTRSGSVNRMRIRIPHR